jgi:hypothetical protein
MSGVRLLGIVLFVLGIGWFLYATGRVARYDSPEGKIRTMVSSEERSRRNFWETSRWLLLGTAVVGGVLIALPGRPPEPRE